MTQKIIRYLVSSADDDYIGELKDIHSIPSFKREINNALCAMNITLARNELTIDSYTDALATESDVIITTETDEALLADIVASTGFGPGTDLELNHKVEIRTHYGEYEELCTEDGIPLCTEDDHDLMVASTGLPEGRTIFKGYISDWEIDLGNDSNIVVSLLNNGTELKDIILKEPGGDTKIPFNSWDPSDIAKYVIDYAQTQGAHINYDTASIEDTGTTVSYEFNLNTIQECLDIIIKLCPADWYWTYDPGSDLYSLQARPVTVQRWFTKKKDVVSGTLRRSILSIVNNVFFTGGGEPALLIERNDATSQADWRRGLAKASDSRVTDPTTGEIMADAEIDRFKEPTFIGNVIINGEHYDPIEDISLGELAGFQNYGGYIDEQSLQIVGINYNVDTISVDLDRILPATPKRIEDLRRNLDELAQQNNPDAPM